MLGAGATVLGTRVSGRVPKGAKILGTGDPIGAVVVVGAKTLSRCAAGADAVGGNVIGTLGANVDGTTMGAIVTGEDVTGLGVLGANVVGLDAAVGSRVGDDVGAAIGDEFG